MSKRKPGMPAGFTLELDRPDDDGPVKSGDYLDEMFSSNKTAAIAVAEPRPKPSIPPSPPAEKPMTKETPRPKRPQPSSMGVTSRTRLNVSAEGRKRLGGIVDHMRKFGPEPDVRASEVIEALILALYDHREHLDMSNVRRRGKYGSATHKNFPITLAESVAGAMATGQADKLL